MRVKTFTIASALVLLVGLVAVQVLAQPTTQPATKAPVTKAEPKADPAPAPKTEPKVEGKVEVVAKDTKVETAKAEEKGEDTQAWWQNLLVTVISTVLSIATPVLSLLLVILLRRWNIKVELDKVQHFAEAGKNYAEQYARNKLKEGKPLDAPEVAKIALEKSRELSEGKLAPWATAKLTDWIEAKVGADNKDKPVTNGSPAPAGTGG